MGMPTDEYWNGDPQLVKYYRKAAEIKRSERNTELWLQGLYVYEAIMDLSPILRSFVKNPKPQPYSKAPYPLSEAEKKRREEAEAEEEAKKTQERLREMALAFNKQLTEKKDNG